MLGIYFVNRLKQDVRKCEQVHTLFTQNGAIPRKIPLHMIEIT